MDVTTKCKQRDICSLTQKEIAMLRSKSKLSDKEIKMWYEEFVRKCPTGKLDQKAFTSLFKRFDSQSDLETCKNMFEFMDENNDGTVDFNEFLFAIAVNNLSGNLVERLDFVFDFWDVSGDGQLDQNELGHLISAMYDRAMIKDRHGDKDPHKRAKEIITKLDLNSDMKLSKEEFINGCKNDEVIANLLAPELPATDEDN
ncbi:hypothetical protein I4U23_019937 [Adineta vaga]|nr:hypothetical protein I4U23_019937 [Adineta vaga]